MSILMRLFKGSTITDQDRVTKLLDSPTTFSQMGLTYSNDKKINKQAILSAATVIYQAILFRIPTVYKEDAIELKELTQIIEYNEDEIVKSLKYKAWNYQQLIKEETDNFVRESGSIMNRIGK